MGPQGQDNVGSWGQDRWEPGDRADRIPGTHGTLGTRLRGHHSHSDHKHHGVGTQGTEDQVAFHHHPVTPPSSSRTITGVGLSPCTALLYKCHRHPVRGTQPRGHRTGSQTLTDLQVSLGTGMGRNPFGPRSVGVHSGTY